MIKNTCVNNCKQQVHDFWNEASCGEKLYLKNITKDQYVDQVNIRYKLEPYIIEFADFPSTKNKKVLEIGVGLGADHQKFAESGAILYGIDLTERAITHTKKRFELLELQSHLSEGDAEKLNFENDFFDQIYSWGVLHHTPNTPKAFDEVYRVLKIGGVAKIMIYHKWSLVGFMLWLRYALIRVQPWISLKEIYASYLESPGTKAYTITEARNLCSKFSDVKITTVLTHGDLLESSAGQRHRGLLLSIAKKLWPRWFFRYFFPKSGLFMLIRLIK
jgi:ubiquinone/menaquinone biosynthesis C-methylase UbiE